jgi:hypothetical protein
MKNPLKIWCITLLMALCAIQTHAQFGGLKDKVKEKVGGSTSTENPRGSRGTPGPNASSNIELDFSSQPFPPAIAWHSLLNNSCVYFNVTNGDFTMNNMLVSFLPQKTATGDVPKYTSASSPLIKMEVTNMADNKIIETLYYTTASAILPYYKLEQVTRVGYKTHAKLIEGKYELHFFAGNKQFYTYPFYIQTLMPLLKISIL